VVLKTSSRVGSGGRNAAARGAPAALEGELLEDRELPEELLDGLLEREPPPT
jgi:hypothetical protein